MTPKATVVIPVGPTHQALADRAAASVAAQTVHTECIRVDDTDGRGPGWARNQGLSQVTTPFVSFLDADDVLAPDFVARTLQHHRDGHYVYTDWWEGDTYRRAPDCAWVNRQWHLVTTLLPTEAVREAGGFDEDLPGAEDTDLYLKLRGAGVCGRVLHVGLVAYTNAGTRGEGFVNSDAYDEVHERFLERYGNHAGRCCEGETKQALTGHPDGVEAVALWRGNRRQRGHVTGYLYPRAGNGSHLRVHPDDIDAAPHIFQRIVRREVTRKPPAWVPQDNDGVMSFEQIAARFAGAMGYDMPSSQARPLAETGPVKPDVQRLVQLYKAARDE